MRNDALGTAARLIGDECLRLTRSARRIRRLADQIDRLPLAVRPLAIVPAAGFTISDALENLLQGPGAMEQARSAYGRATGKTMSEAGDDIAYAIGQLQPLGTSPGEEALLRSAADRLLHWLASGREADPAMEEMERAFSWFVAVRGRDREAYAEAAVRFAAYKEAWLAAVQPMD